MEIRIRVGFAVVLLVVGGFFSYLLKVAISSSVPRDGTREGWYFAAAFTCFIVALLVPSCCERTYIDFARRRIVSVKNYAWYKLYLNSRPLTDFSHIVVRHLCHADEGGQTFTGSIGIKPLLDRGPIVWVKDFDTTQDAVPREAEEFASRLCELTGLPLSGLWIGDAGFADRLHQGTYSPSQYRSPRSLEPTLAVPLTIQNRSVRK